MLMRVTVILSDEEYAEAKRRAGLIPLSAWFRSMAFGDFGAETVRKDGTVRVVRGSASAPKRPDKPPAASWAEACPHHKRRGDLCYKCDSKFGLPAIP